MNWNTAPPPGLCDAQSAPLRRNTESSEVGDTGLFLISDAARGITGEVLYVDGGYHVMGM